jgi:hypothetical protein
MICQIAGIFLLFILGTSIPASADWSAKSDLFLFGDARYLNQHQFSEYKALFEFSGAIGSDLTYRKGIFEFAIRPEIRWINSPGVGVPPNDISYVSVEGPPRYFNLSGSVSKTSEFELVAGLEKLSFSIQTEHVEFAVGRRALGLGVLKYLPIWNKFTVVLPTQVGPPYIYNPDNVVFRYQQGAWSESLLGIGGPTPADSTKLAQLNYFGDWIEVQTLVGEWWEDAVAGLAFSKDIQGLTVRAESLWIGLNPDDPDHLYQIGGGLEYAFTEKVSAIFEGIYLSNGANDIDDYPLTPVSRFSPFRASRYGLLTLDYKYLPNWRLMIGVLSNWVDASSLGLAELRWSTSDESELTLQAKVPFGALNTEFSPQTFTFPDGSYVGYPYIANLFYKVYF